MSRLGKWVAVTQLTPTSVQPIHPEHRDLYIVLEENDKPEPAQPSWKKLFNWTFKRLKSPSTLHIYYRKDSNEASEQMVAQNTGKLWQYNPIVDNVTGLTICTEYNAQTTLSGILAMVMACVQPIAINHVTFVNPFAMNSVKTTQIQCWWYEEITRIDPAERNSDSLHAYILVVNWSSQQLFSSLTVRIRLWQRLLASVQQWYTTARLQWTESTYFEQSCLNRSGRLVDWLLAEDRFTCPTNIRQTSSKFPSCSIVVLTINLGVQVSIFWDWNCGSYSLEILLWHTTNGNEG